MTDARISIMGVADCACYTANRRISKSRHEPAQHVGTIVSRGIREQQNIASGFLDGSILRGGLSETFLLTMKTYAAWREAPDDLVGTIGRAVGSDKDFEFVFGIVERQCVLKLLGQVAFLVVGGDDDGQRRRKLPAYDRLRADVADEYQ